MNDIHVGRNDPCPCGSGKKFKKCCLQGRGSPYAVAPARAVAKSSPRYAPTPYSGPLAATLTAPRLSAAPADKADDTPAASSIPVLPVEVALHYTFPEAFGTAEVTYIFPAGQLFLLPDGRTILNDNLKAGMQVRLQDGVIAMITAVHLSYEPPDPPCLMPNGLWLSRVIGTIKHIGFAVSDVTWAGSTVTGTPDHRYYSVSRQAWVPAQELRVGEFLRTDDNLVARVEAVSEPRYGFIELYNCEVEHFHNYFVGGAQGGKGALVHNGTQYINTPGQPRRFSNVLGDAAHEVPRFRLEMRNGKWVIVSERGAVRSATGNHLFVVAQDGTIYVTPRRPPSATQAASHFDLSGGRDVIYAGEIRFSNRNHRGNIVWWNNQSGHFRPGPEFAQQAGLPMDLFRPVTFP